jgi:hypothetical protein
MALFVHYLGLEQHFKKGDFVADAVDKTLFYRVYKTNIKGRKENRL